MSEPAKAVKPATPKPAVTKPGTAPLPKQPGQSPATPAMAKLRRALGELITAFKNRKTHMFQIYAFELRSSLDAALKVRHVATETERTELDGMRARAQVLLTYASSGSTKAVSEEEILGVDWDFISDSIDQISPGFGPLLTQMPQVYRDSIEAVGRMPFFAGQAFGEQWERIAPHWPAFVKAAALMLGMQLAAGTLAAIPEPSMATKIVAVVLQAALVAFVVQGLIGALESAVNVQAEASSYAHAFLANVQAAKGDRRLIDAAALNLARLLVMVVDAIAVKVIELGLRTGVEALREYGASRAAAKAASKDSKARSTANSVAPATGTSPDSNSSNTGATKPPHSGNAAKPPTPQKTEKTRVNEPVKGVWEQAEKPRFGQAGATHLEFHDTPIVHERDGTRSMKTLIVDHTKEDPLVGWVERAYNPRTRTLELRNAFLDKVPNKIRPKQGAMLTPDGTPTQTFLSLHQMKALGANYGDLKKIKMSTIQNIRSVIELEAMSAKGMSLDEAVAKTYSVTYANTTVTQSGHRVVGVQYVKNQEMRRPFDRLLEHYELDHATNKRVPSIVAEHDRLIATYGNGVVSRQTPVRYNYDIELTVEPFAGRKP